jgi:hypothetical protein
MGICLVLLPILYMTVTGINRRSGEVLMSNDTVNNFAKVYPANLEGGGGPCRCAVAQTINGDCYRCIPCLVLSRLRSGLSTHLCGLSLKCQGAFAAER